MVPTSSHNPNNKMAFAVIFYFSIFNIPCLIFGQKSNFIVYSDNRLSNLKTSPMHYKNKIFEEKEVRGEHFSDCQFSGCAFPKINLKFTTFNNCTFTACDLSSIDCESTGFANCSFPESKLSNLNFLAVKFTDCDFSGAMMQNCVFEKRPGKNDLPAKKFSLISCKFEETDLSGSIFFLCDLTGVSFRNSKLEKAGFEKCTLRRANFTGATINGAHFTDCTIEKTILDFQGFIHFGNSHGFELNS